MADEMVIEHCPETGICSIVRSSKSKVDLMPSEVKAIREARGDAEAVRKILAESDEAFASMLDADTLAQIGVEV